MKKLISTWPAVSLVVLVWMIEFLIIVVYQKTDMGIIVTAIFSGLILK